jgi:ADP-ribose pyrophosphatase YjhB (NUDIX family)
MIKCEFENGSAAGLRHLTVDIIIIRGTEVLLNKRGSYKGKPLLESGKWALMGGFMDRDETVKEAITRETMEEAGCTINNIRLFRIVDNPNRPKEDRQNVTFIFIADFVSKIETQTEEVQELKWFPLNDLPPIEVIAFDHGENLIMYRDFLADKNSNSILDRFPAIII